MNAVSDQPLTDDSARMLVAPGFEHDLAPRWFSPDFWGARARAVGTGGRGSAWFLDTQKGAMVLRHYLRGGFMAKLYDDSYTFLGYQRTRSFQEFRLLQALSGLGLPVPEPIGAWVRRVGILRYEARILIRRIPDAVPLPEAKVLSAPELWRDVGQVIRRFHDAGLDHADLNCDNILVAPEQIYLIDFDKCRLREKASPAARWKQHNLARLGRSVQKRCANLPASTRTRLWQALKEGYLSA
ncbi:MAG: 3-deoxy-D-manno-octulosonic acid kinase [Pseudomonadota bacterium]|nr:3-deoxy-D-manno-octulosonic acid kinase [Pseudomonadota bacterium]